MLPIAQAGPCLKRLPCAKPARQRQPARHCGHAGGDVFFLADGRDAQGVVGQLSGHAGGGAAGLDRPAPPRPVCAVARRVAPAAAGALAAASAARRADRGDAGAVCLCPPRVGAGRGLYAVFHLATADHGAIDLGAARAGARRALGMVGVLVALRPSQEAFFTLGALAVLASAVCYAVSAIAGRMLTRTDPSSSLVFWTTTMLALGAGLLAWPQWVGVTWTHWPLLAGLAVTGSLGQLAITEAFRHGQVSVVAPFEYTAIAWGVGLDWLLWQAVPGYSTLLGAVIVIGSGLYLVRQERTQAVLPP